MNLTVKGCKIFSKGRFAAGELSVQIGVFSAAAADAPVFHFDNAYIMPGFVDVHVHFREPGFSYKETIVSGSRAAAHGGYTTVCPMPNLNPVPDSMETLEQELSLIRAGAKNFKDVVIVPSKAEYPLLLDILNKKGAKTDIEDRKMFAEHAFGVSSHYDTAIHNWFAKK